MYLIRLFSILIILSLGVLVSCTKEAAEPESKSAINYTKIGAYTRIAESITLSNGNRVFVGEDDGAAVVYVFDERADLLWQKRIDYPGRNVFAAVAEMANGNIVVAGSTNSAFFETNNQTSDILSQCYTPSGEEVWTTVTGSKDDEYILDLIIDSKGNCVLTGSAHSNFWKSYTMKLSADGRYLWSRQYTFDAFSEGRGIVELDNGRYMISGTAGNEVYKWPYVALIYTNGILQDEFHFTKYLRYVDRDRDDYSVNMLPTNQGFLMSYFYLPTQRKYPSVQLIEVTQTGTLVRVKELLGYGATKPIAMRKDGAGYLICGASSSNLDYEIYGFGESKSYVTRLDENLKMDWQSGVGSNELVQTAYDVSRKGNRISVGCLSQLQGSNSASLLHYWLDETGNSIYQKGQE